jgi:hypothetical protein
MFARSSNLGIVALMALSVPASDPSFTLGATGAVTLTVNGDQAQYGLQPGMSERHRMITIDLGGNQDAGTLSFYLLGDRLPSAGRYPIQYSLDPAQEGVQFHACFVAGTPERPVGVFHAEGGWLTITTSEAGRVAGEFEVRARGFLAAKMDDENQWVTVRGTFDARGDSTIATVASVAAVAN